MAYLFVQTYNGDRHRTPPWIQGWLFFSLIPHGVLSCYPLSKSANIEAIQTTRILEAAAISCYHEQKGKTMIEILIADDAPQFKHLTKELFLCWVHDGRHYKKLQPVIAYHREILTTFLTHYWEFYRKLLDYKECPTTVMAETLSEAFDLLFSTHTDYRELNERIAKTKAKKPNSFWYYNTRSFLCITTRQNWQPERK
jgi:hypothetical protein